MDSAQDLLREGRLPEALQALQQQVRAQPADPKLRVFLFQLLILLGEWSRALNQLNVLKDMDPNALAMYYTYREAMQCEVLRSEVFAGNRTPLLFGEPEPWMAPLIEALGSRSQGNPEARTALINQAFESSPTSAGSINGDPFEWIADGDSRIGPCLEAIVDGKYYWIPFSRIKRIQIEPPEDLRDSVWLPAYFTWATEGEGIGLIPSRYPESHLADDAALQMARATHWEALQPDTEFYSGLGQRQLVTDSDDYPLLDCREILIHPAQ